MNYMKQVAQMLGLEFEEEFYLKGVLEHKYKITNDGVFFRSKKDGSWLITSWSFSKILTGELEIIKKPILDEAEKKYLSNVIKPFRGKVKYIVKRNENESEYKSEYFESIRVVFEGSYWTLFFPYFEKGTMYKGMELDKEYTLEELGL